jgi:hypothetical protein
MTVAVEDGDVVGSEGAMSGFRRTSSLEGATVEEAVEVRRFIPGGLGACRAFSYNPHALQMILPFISRRHRGVEVVPQFLDWVRLLNAVGGKITSIAVQILKRNEILSLFRQWSSEREKRSEHAVSRYYIFIRRVSVIFPPSSAESSLPEMVLHAGNTESKVIGKRIKFCLQGETNLIIGEEGGCCSRVCAFVGCDVVFSVGAKNTPLLACSRHPNKI